MTPFCRWYFHDDIITWKHFTCYCPFMRGIHRSPMELIVDSKVILIRGVYQCLLRSVPYWSNTFLSQIMGTFINQDLIWLYSVCCPHICYKMMSFTEAILCYLQLNANIVKLAIFRIGNWAKHVAMPVHGLSSCNAGPVVICGTRN